MTAPDEKRTGPFARAVRRFWCRKHHPWTGYELTDDERVAYGRGLGGSWSRKPCRWCRGFDDEMPRVSSARDRDAVLHQAALHGLRLQGVDARIGAAGRLLAPGYGQCSLCKTPWCFVENHSTEYAPGRGMFPLCEKCWQELGTPEDRMPHYRLLWNRWQQSSDPDGPTWDDIEAAVVAEASSSGSPRGEEG